MPQQSALLALETVGRGELDLVGGKAANLGELIRAGFTVPAGLVISTEAYSEVVRTARLAPLIAEQVALGDDGSAIRAGFAGVEFSDALRTHILVGNAALGKGPVAVRSSATAEDLPGAAFAGQQDSYLNVTGDDALLDAVRRCWGSLWSDRAIAYRRRLGIDPSEVAMAVIVQRMVHAEFAGVLFTADPVSGDRSTVSIDAVAGLGEAVASGLVTPHHYLVDPSGRISERVPGEGGGAPPDSVITELASIGRRVAKRFGRPQDIEWAYAGGAVSLVQARPMTALPPEPLQLNRIQRIVGRQLVEMLPYRPYPLDLSAWTLPAMGRMVRRMLFEIAGVHIDFAAMLPESGGVVARLIPPTPRPTLRTLSAPIRLLPRIRRYDPSRWTGDPRFADFDRAITELTAVDPGALGWAELAALPGRALRAVDVITDLRVDYLPRTGAALARLRLLVKLLGLIELFPLLVLGAATRTQDANRALAALAATVRANPMAHTAFQDLEGDDLADRIARDPDLAAFNADLTAFLAEYGHRETASVILMSSPTWGEAPAVVLGMIKMMAAADDDRAVPDRAPRALRRLLQARAVRWTRSGVWVLRAANAAQAGVAFREDSHFHASRALPVLRAALLEMGRRIAAAEVLRNASDVLHLRLTELIQAGDPPLMTADTANRLRALVRERSTRRAELAGVPLIGTSDLFPAQPGDTDTLITGTPASGGRVTGTVRVIRESADFGTLRPGEILVCPYTNPGWTPLFERAAAVVVDTGGLASHAAIVAREYGIPAIMGSGHGTTVLADGQLVTVDGDTGRVLAAKPVAQTPGSTRTGVGGSASA